VTTAIEVRAIRRGVLVGGMALVFSQFAFGMVFGLAARDSGFSLLEAVAMSALAYSGAAQFAAAGLIAQGVPWAGIVVLTALLNARHLLYSASLAPWFASAPRRVRAVAAHGLTDEVYALTLPAFGTLRRLDLPSYAIAVALTLPTWIIATAAGFLGGELLPDPRVLGLDVVFPAVMAALAVVLITDRRALIAAVAGATIGLAVALLVEPSVGVMAGGLVGPLVAMLAPGSSTDRDARLASDGMPG